VRNRRRLAGTRGEDDRRAAQSWRLPRPAPTRRRQGRSGNPSATANFHGEGEHVDAILGGKYKLIGEIGEGGMGSVFMAQQTEPVKRVVAVKVAALVLEHEQIAR
jgi:hypothetical protein